METPGFNTWTVIFLFAALQAAILSIILASLKKGQQKANRILAIMMGLFSLTLIHYIAFWTGYIRVYPHFMALSTSFPFLYGPLLWTYLHKLYNRPLGKFYFLHFLPFLILLIILSPRYLLSAEEKRILMQQGHNFNYRIVAWIQIIHMISYGVIAYRFHRKQTGNWKQWRNTLFFAYGGFVSSFITYYLLILHPDFSPSWDYMISGAMCVFIFLVALMGYIQPEIFSGKTMVQALKPEKYAHSSLNTHRAQILTQRLDMLMEEQRLFLNPQINLPGLAKTLNISTHQLSQLLNEYKGLSFSDYINQLRVEAVLKRMEDINYLQTPAIQIAYEVGFNNKVSFYQHFKKITGKTPGQYKKLVNQ